MEGAKLREDAATPQGRLFAATRRIEELRRSHCVFDAAADAWLLDTNSDQVLGIGRWQNGEKLLALFNFSDEEQEIRMGNPERYIDLWTGEPRNADVLRLPAGDFAWLLKL